jgi:transcriptional regulator with XRE-family HTH domain
MTPMDERLFLRRLWEIQQARSLSGVELARRLGVHHSTISRLKSGKQGAGREGLRYRFVEAAILAFPELAFVLPAELRTIIRTGRIGTETPPGTDA